ncbi:MAG: transposase [Microthrixaceae bacterium]
MTDNVVPLMVGARILTADGYAVVVRLERHGVRLRFSTGPERSIAFSQLDVRSVSEHGIQAVHASLFPWWQQLELAVQHEALFKQECVLECRTGFRYGLIELAQEGEPFYPFGPEFGLSLRARYAAMSKVVSFERSVDRVIMRRVYEGELKSHRIAPRTLQRWDTLWSGGGLRALVDGRSIKDKQGFEAIDPTFRRIALEKFAEYDGSRSRPNLQEIERQIRVALKNEGVEDPNLPDRLVQEFLSQHWRATGSTVRAQRSKSLRKVAGHESYPAQHPGELATDLTIVNNFVLDPLQERAINVEVGVIHSIATRVIHGIRVFPRGARGIDVGLLVYDAMRQMSMVVEGTTIDDFRWCGIPESLDLSGNPVHVGRRPALNPGRSLQGVHYLPGVTPTSIRSDHGSIFVGEHFRALMDQFGIELRLSRGKKPTDNPHSERKMEDLERAYQQIPGYKGRSVKDRGRFIGIEADEPLLTAEALERHLKLWVALDYHRMPHDGLALPGAPGIRLTPLEMHDAMADATGRILVPQHPDLIYQFLPIIWLAPGHSGVEHKNLTYDAPVLEEFRSVRVGTFRAKDHAIPFHLDPRDMTRLWFRHPETDRIHEIPWKARHLIHAPLVDDIVDRALKRIRERGGNRSLNKTVIMRQIIDEIGELTTAPATDEWRAKMAAAQLRWEQSQRDHAEVAEAHRLIEEQVASGSPRVAPVTHDAESADEPGVIDFDAPLPDYGSEAV